MERLFVNRDSKDLTISEVFEMFIRAKQCANLSQYTITYYKGCFSSFEKFYDVSQPCTNISLETVEDYIFFIKNNTNMNDVTINTNLRGMRAFLYFAMQRGYVKQFKIQLIRAQKKIKATYTDEELAILLKKPNMKKCSFAEYRNWAMINYLLATGNRLETMSKVKIGDIDFNNHEIILKSTKSKKQYVIPLSQELSKVLSEYLTYRKGEREDYLFCTVYGNSLAKRAIQSQIKAYNEKHGVLKTSIHVFRHTFAKKWILNGGDIMRLQSLLGHSNIEMVKEYVNMFSNDLKNGFNSFNPLDNFVRDKKSGEHIRMH